MKKLILLDNIYYYENCISVIHVPETLGIIHTQRNSGTLEKGARCPDIFNARAHGRRDARRSQCLRSTKENALFQAQPDIRGKFFQVIEVLP